MGISFSDERARLPEDDRDNIIEKYIILGDMVLSHATISTTKESVETFFAPLARALFH